MIAAAPEPRPGRTALAVSVALLAAILTAILGVGPASAAGFEPGQIIVAPQSQSIAEFPATRATDGEEVPVLDILEQAAGAGRLDLDTFPRITIAGRTLNRSQVISAGPALNVVFEPDRTVINLPGGGSATYGAEETFAFTPKIVVFPKAADFDVTVTPRARTVKSGTTVRFKATVTGTTGKLSFNWSFGDGSSDLKTAGSVASHLFRGNDRTFPVTLTVTEAGNTRNGTGSAVITIGKSAEKPEKKAKEKEPKRDDGPPPPANHDGGSYSGNYGGPGEYGGSYDNPGPPSSGPAAPATPQPKKRKPAPVVDDGLVPVRGELLDPSIPTQVIDPATTQPGGSSDPAPETASDGGFALSGGAKTAIGIAALLGIGGLAEIRAFARFR